MKTIAYTLSAAVLGLGIFMAAPASAAPVGPMGIDRPATGIELVRMSPRERRRARMMRMRRGGEMKNRMRPANAGNARNPSRPVMQQNQGMTSGGARY